MTCDGSAEQLLGAERHALTCGCHTLVIISGGWLANTGSADE